MKLYHGTNGRWLQSILRNGLEPRGTRTARNNWRHVRHQSNPHAVYLTDSYAPYFAFNSCRGNEPQCVVLEIETDVLEQNRLIPDEDCWEQLGRGRDGVPGDMSQRTVWYRRQLYLAARGRIDPDILSRYTDKCDPTLPAWQLSMKALGTAAYLGTVPPQAVVRWVVWDHQPNAWLQLVWDPTITIVNQRICGDRYRALTAKLFGDEPTPLNEFDERVVNSFDPNKIEGLRRGTI